MVKRKIEEIADGLFMEPVPITLGDEVRLKYQGLLAEDASQVFLRTGYGHGNWTDVRDIKMRKGRDGGWTASFTVKDPTRLNFCFHDGTKNWDNNNGMNWSYEIHDGSRIGH